MSFDYSKGPVVLFYEITKACALSCRHCRAHAQPKRHPSELTTQESMALVDEIGRFSPKPILIISGGDPLMRRDLFEVAAYAVSQGVRTSLSPSVTALVTPKNLARVYQAGVRHISFSLDGATPEVHDGFRGVAGAFDRTLGAIGAARDAGLTVQLNTTVSRWNSNQLEALAEVVARSGAVLWDVFFMVPTGRAQAEEVLSAEEHEKVFQWLHHLSRTSTLSVKTTMGQPFRRVMLQQAAKDGVEVDSVPSANDGKGICFISHVGEIFPSGFLPLECGNVRTDSLVEVYRTHPVFRALRDPDALKGKCGRCGFRVVCGGCRARAYGFTGDYLEAEPCCAYVEAATGGVGAAAAS
ncbi:MAG: radical protein [Dehalococcoidia bacterium]|nr:radical protein [Dehalococcoidia bacterium]